MAERVIFSFTYPTGAMTFDVGSFFGCAPAANTKKMLKLLRQHCTEEQKKELLLDLIEEDRRRKALLDTLSGMEFKRELLLSEYFDCSVKRDLAQPEKALVKQRKKIQAVVDTIKGEEWLGF